MRIVRALAALAAQPRGTRRLLTVRFASNNAVADAEVLAALNDPVVLDVRDPDEDWFNDENGRVNKGALVLYNYLKEDEWCCDTGTYLNYLPPPPAGVYGTPAEVEKQRAADREEYHFAAWEREFYELP